MSVKAYLERLVPLYSTEGRKRLIGASNLDDFWRLLPNFQPQVNAVYCGIASAVIVANTLRIRTDKAPNQPALGSEDIGGVPYRAYSQLLFMNSETEDIKSRAAVIGREKIKRPDGTEELDPGVSLSILARLLESHQFTVELEYASESNEDVSERLRHQLLSKVEDAPDTFIIANFATAAVVEGARGGHMAPIAAYHEDSDSVLLMDVASHRSTWNWIPITDLVEAMRSKDGHMPRGWLLVWDD